MKQREKEERKGGREREKNLQKKSRKSLLVIKRLIPLQPQRKRGDKKGRKLLVDVEKIFESLEAIAHRL